MSKQDDFDLIIAFIKDKNRMAFNTLVQKHKDMVFNLCYQFISQYEDAEDCAQETFIKVYKNLHKFQFKSAFKTWLYRITINTCKNKINSKEFKTRRKSFSKDSHPKFNDKPLDLKDNQTPSVESQLEIKDQMKQLKAAIDLLPIEQKTLILLRDYENHSYDEIAEITGIKLGTIKSKLSRARESLKITLKGEK